MLFYSNIGASSIFEPTQGSHTITCFTVSPFSPFLYMRLPPPFARAATLCRSHLITPPFPMWMVPGFVGNNCLLALTWYRTLCL
jgi:hypothetical protein